EAFLDGLPEGSAQLPETMELHGIDRFVAREQIVARMEALGLLAKVETRPRVVPHGERSGVAIEPLLTEQWYVDATKLAIRAAEAVRGGRRTFVRKHWETAYLDWMENIQPWCISRQLWWGHQIPAWYGWALDGEQLSIAKTKVFVAETQALALEQARD